MITSKQLIARTGITYRQLDYWCRCRYLLANGEGAGSGIPRSFDEEEIPVALLLSMLSSFDMLLPAGRGRRDYLTGLLNHVRENGLVGLYRIADGAFTINLARIVELAER